MVVRGAEETEAVALAPVPVPAGGAPGRDQTERMAPAPQNSTRLPAQGLEQRDSEMAAVVIVLPQ